MDAIDIPLMLPLELFFLMISLSDDSDPCEE